MPIAKIVKLSNKGQMAIPKKIREKLGVKPGGRLLVTEKKGEIVLLSPEKYAENTRGFLKGTWGRTKSQVEKYLKKERDSWK